jgi:hypothetical protein
MHLLIVFEIVDDAPNDAAASVDGNCGVKMDLAMSAIRAGERSADCALKRLRTNFTERRDNRNRFVIAVATEMFAGIDTRCANRARRRIKQRSDRGAAD